MSRVSPLLSTFNAGEWSPNLYGRTDLGRYANACKRMENFIPLVQGAATRRPGTRFVSRTKSDGIVDWRYCVTGDPEIDCEVAGTHVGLVFNPAVYRLLAGRLARGRPKEAAWEAAAGHGPASLSPRTVPRLPDTRPPG